MRGGWLAVAAIAAIVLGGCAHKPPPPAPQPVEVLPPETPPLPRSKPKPPSRPAPRPAAPASVPAPAPVGPIPDMVLVGFSQAEIKALLGEPAERSRQGAGESWIYRGIRCTVEIPFFFDVTRNGFYALDRHVEGTDGSESAAQECLRQIREGNEAR